MPKFLKSLLALPVLTKTNGHDGLTVTASSICFNCQEPRCLIDQEQSNPQNPEIKLCYKGVAYIKLFLSGVICGFFPIGWKPPFGTNGQRKRLFRSNLREEPDSTIDLDVLLSTVARMADAVIELGKQHEEEEQFEQYNEQLQNLTSFKDWIDTVFSRHFQSFNEVVGHDALQLISLVSQNMDGCLERRYGNTEAALRSTVPNELKLGAQEKAKIWEHEKSVYYVSQLAIMRLEMIQLMAGGDQFQFDDHKDVSVHRAFQKVVKPYRVYAKSKGIQLSQIGNSYFNTYAPIKPFHIPILAIIDNAVKYAIRGETITVSYKDTDDSIVVSIESNGPRINDEEETLIFDRGYRGLEARRYSNSYGHGIGLWIANLLLNQWNATLSLSQDSEPIIQYKNKSRRYRTIFTVTYERKK